jgi:hypothetical protein
MKKDRNKMMTAEKSETKSDPSLICVSECNVPGVGTWKTGDRISDPETISKIAGSPCFKPIQEVE